MPAANPARANTWTIAAVSSWSAMGDLLRLHWHGRMPTNPRGDQGMGMLDGISQCWWLSETCVIDWTAWSAIATCAAVVAALLVGVLPIRHARKVRKTQMRVLAKVAVDDLFIQEVNLRAAMLIPAANIERVDHWDYVETVKCSSIASPKAAADLIPYSDFLPKKVEDALAQAIATLTVAQQRRIFVVPTKPGETCNLSGEVKWVEAVCRDILALRKQLCEWVNVAVEDPSDNVAGLSAALRRNAAVERNIWARENAPD